MKRTRLKFNNTNAVGSNQHEIKVKPLKRSSRKAKMTAYSFAGIFVILFLITFIHIVSEYIDTHKFTWQSPILVQAQAPLVIERDMVIVSPVATRSGLIHTSYAEEITEIDPAKVDMFNSQEIKAYVRQEALKKWGSYAEWDALEELLMRESGFDPYAKNSSSGALGLFQSLPGTKYGEKGLELGNQVAWGLSYIEDRYGSPSEALSFHDDKNWY